MIVKNIAFSICGCNEDAISENSNRPFIITIGDQPK